VQTSGQTLGAYGAAVANDREKAWRDRCRPAQESDDLLDFDSSEIRPDYNALITAHAHYLASNASIRCESRATPMNALAGIQHRSR